MLLYAHVYCYDDFCQRALNRGMVPCFRVVTSYKAVPGTTVEVLPRSRSVVGAIPGSRVHSVLE